MPNFSIKLTVLDKDLEEMAPELMSVLYWDIPQAKREIVQRSIQLFLKDWEQKNTSMYDTGEI